MIDLEGILKDKPSILPDKETLEARELAISYIRFSGSKSSGQVIKHLRSKELSEDLIATIVQDLKADAWIDDARLARRILEDRQGRRIEGESALRQRMLQRGIPYEVADEVLAERDVDESRDVETFFNLRCAKEIKTLKSSELSIEESRKLSQRILRRASGRGFSIGVCLQVLREMGITVHDY